MFFSVPKSRETFLSVTESHVKRVVEVVLVIETVYDRNGGAFARFSSFETETLTYLRIVLSPN